MGRLLDDLERKLKAIENNLAEEVAKDTNELFEDSVRYALVDWYNGYDPTVYKRTNNFMNVLKTARTSGKGNLLTFSVSSGDMRTYKGFDIPPYKGYQKQSLQPSTAILCGMLVNMVMDIGKKHNHCRHPICTWTEMFLQVLMAGWMIL